MEDRELYSIEDARFLLGGIARKAIYDLLNDGELRRMTQPTGGDR
jgi:hypothetical protein